MKNFIKPVYVKKDGRVLMLGRNRIKNFFLKLFKANHKECAHCFRERHAKRLAAMNKAGRGPMLGSSKNFPRG